MSGKESNHPGCPDHPHHRKVRSCAACRRIYINNRDRARRGEPTHCQKNHKYTPETTRWRTVRCKDGSSRQVPICKLCEGAPKKPIPEFCSKHHRLLLPDGTPTDNLWVGVQKGKHKLWHCRECDRQHQQHMRDQKANLALLTLSLDLDTLLDQMPDGIAKVQRSCAPRHHPGYLMEKWAEDYRRERALGRGFTRRLADRWGTDLYEASRRIWSLRRREFIDPRNPIGHWRVTRETCLNAGWGYMDIDGHALSLRQWQVLKVIPSPMTVYKFWKTWPDFKAEVEATWEP